MAQVTGLTAERMLEIEAASIVDGEVVGDNLILTRHDESTIDAGNVRGPEGPVGPEGPPESIEAWKNFGDAGQPAFQNGWVNNSEANWGKARFRKDRNVVTLHGAVSGGSAANSVIATLPVGYRPANRRRFFSYTNSGVGTIEIGADGTIATVGAGAVGTTFLDAIRFYVD